jgi:hypothetical protein
MENKPRSLAVCSSHAGPPQIWVRGAWVYDFGFDAGDQTEITNPEPGVMVIRVKTPAAEMRRFRHRRQLEMRLEELKAGIKLTEGQLAKMRSLETGLQAA